MSSSDDTAPPEAPPTNPQLEIAIPTGQATKAVASAFVDLLAAVARLEATCMAVARGLDDCERGDK